MRLLLVGLMATGKSSVAREVAARTGWPCLDNDTLLTRATGRTAAQLLEQDGTAALRRAESDVLTVLLGLPGPWVAGAPAGTVLDPRDRERLASVDRVVWLTAPPEVLARRAAAQPDRAWLDQDPVAVLRAMAAERDPLFRELADQVVDTGVLNPAHAARTIVDALPAT